MAAAAGWVALVVAGVVHLARTGSVGHDHALGLGWSHSFAVGLAWWAVMAVAMMVPVTLPSVRHVALGSTWRRRHRAVAVFLAAFLGVWLAFGTVIVAVSQAAVSRLGPAATVVVAFAAAAAWQVSPAKRRGLRRCGRTMPLAPHGWRADRDCAHFGAVAGWSCVLSCWALMAATVAAAHSLVVMAVLFAVQLDERLRRRPASGASAVVVAGLGALVLAARALHSH